MSYNQSRAEESESTQYRKTGGSGSSNQQRQFLGGASTKGGGDPPPHTPMAVMHKAEKKYYIGKVAYEEQARQRQFKGILNKLTPQNFEKLFEQVKQVNIDNVITLFGVVSQIFDKALMEPTFCEMYANFCFLLAAELPDLSVDNEKITFKRLLLNKCQEEFERGEEEANKAEKEGEVKQTVEERYEKRLKTQRRKLGTIRLIGELYKKRILTERIMHECINKLLGQYQNPDEENIEALCKLMSTIGEMIDHPEAEEHMDAYFDIMSQLSNNMKLSSRVRFMLKDAIDLRKNKWQQRRKVEGSKKIEEVDRDVAQERQEQSTTESSSLSSSQLPKPDLPSQLPEAETEKAKSTTNLASETVKVSLPTTVAASSLTTGGAKEEKVSDMTKSLGTKDVNSSKSKPETVERKEREEDVNFGPQGRNNSDSDRWQRAIGFQRGLMPPPHTPMVVMHKAEKKYYIGKVAYEEQAKQRQFKSILKKLTPQNFEKLFEQVKQVNIDNVITLSGVVSQIFDKALMEPTFCEMYANFCFLLAAKLPDLSVDNEKITFKRLLLNKCQEEFEREEDEANKAEKEGEVKQTVEERDEKRLKTQRRKLGTIRLIGELYKKRILTERIMHECINKLLGQYQNPDEENIEALCKLMSTIGEMIDHPKAEEHMDAYFDIMSQLSNNMKLSSRVRFMLKDAINLRKNKWQQRRKVEGSKKIEEVDRDVAQERQAQSTTEPSSLSSSQQPKPDLPSDKSVFRV